MRFANVRSLGGFGLLAAGLVVVAVAPRALPARAASPAALERALPEGTLPEGTLPEGTLKDAMQRIDKAFKELSKGIKADTRDAALTSIVALQQAVISAKEQVPEAADDFDGKKKGEFINGFRKAQIELLKVACDIEVAIVDGKYKDAENLVKNKLPSLKQAGHGKYQPAAAEPGDE